MYACFELKKWRGSFHFEFAAVFSKGPAGWKRIARVQINESYGYDNFYSFPL